MKLLACCHEWRHTEKSHYGSITTDDIYFVALGMAAVADDRGFPLPEIVGGASPRGILSIGLVTEEGNPVSLDDPAALKFLGEWSRVNYPIGGQDEMKGER